ncbi:PREDICTED: uncharacterized protein LOC109159918 [Ipomoea nil]|uniref:uncharacterized protein LOC109159918 n=1 Tax=Ipomoea nil TaxID=35883 RepID=UPI000901DC1C|nr:PREDICTED: uncharacterized protein LOC109159918 [Ipomoea nil]
MYPDKSPGPDGLTPGFYQQYWDILKGEVVSLCNAVVSSGALPNDLNNTHIALIPKVKQATSMGDLRPIALCIVLYRILAKVLASRLKHIMGGLISESQSAFVPGRSIVDNVFLAYEVVHFMHCSNQHTPEKFVALKLDMSKAFDRVEWGYMEAVMLCMGFSAHWEEMGGITGVRIARNAPGISHLCFADDLLLFFRANYREVGVINDVLNTFGAATGQIVNYDKSVMSFGSNVNWVDKDILCAELGVRQTGLGSFYLGLPGLVGRNKRDVLGWIKDKIKTRIGQWGNRFMSRAGREILLKNVLQSIPNYAMQVLLLPKGLCEEIERLMNSYWWGCEAREGRRGIRWRRWADLCKPKSMGGLGFRRIREMNIALLGKQVWGLLTRPDALITKVVKAKYFPSTSVLDAKIGTRPSYVWKSLDDESLMHIFANCTYATQVWNAYGRDWGCTTGGDLLNWLRSRFDTLTQTELIHFITVCWGIWEARNKKIWNMLNTPPRSVVTHSIAFLREWKNARKTTTVQYSRLQQVQELWAAPPNGKLKLNIDASIHHNSSHIGMGWIIRDHHGFFVAAISDVRPGPLSPREAEALAVREALSWLKRHHWDGLVVETDAEILLTHLHKLSRSPFGLLIEDITALLSSFNDITFRHVRRTANAVAHLLASYAFSHFASMTWYDSGPLFISTCKP